MMHRGHTIKRFSSYQALPEGAAYLGSTEGPVQMSEETAGRLDDATAPAYIKDDDGHRHFFDLCPTF